MKSRNALFTALALGLTLSAPVAFAQDAASAPTQDPAASAPTATPADPAAQATDPAATAQQAPATDPAAQAAPEESKKVTWSDLDTDKDGKLNKTEVASVPALTQVFDDADADKDGALTPDEYKASAAKSQGGAAPADGSAQPQGEG